MNDLLYDEICAIDIVEGLKSVDDLFLSDGHQINPNQYEFTLENIHFFDVGIKRMVLVLNYPAKLYFTGTLLIECLSGAVDIHGYTLRPDGLGSRLIHSGYGQSALCLSSKKVSDFASELDLKVELNKRRISEKDILEVCSSSSVLILSKCNEPPIFNLISSEKRISLINGSRSSSFSLFGKPEEWFNCIFDISSGSRIVQKMVYHPILIKLASDISDMKDPRVMICGGKGVGKSTALQYLVNRMFDKWKTIMIIDFDIGQPEFTIPGCVSVLLINHPLLGPNFTHLWKPLRSIVLGYVNPDMCLTKYFVAIDELKKFCESIQHLYSFPWIINTMGYIKGFGLSIIVKIISSFQPSHIVQINSKLEPNLNVFPLTSENIAKIAKCQSVEFCNYELVTFQSQNSKNTAGIPPKLSREIRVLSYMTMNGHKSDLLIKQVSLKHKSMKEIESFKPNKIIAVCAPWSGSSSAECIGFGIILERNNDVVFFLTPLSEEELKSHCDICTTELDLQGVLWEKLTLIGNRKTKQNIIRLRKKSTFASALLF